jgi:hypothetical protein
MWLVALMAGVMLAFTGCGGSSGGGDDEDNKCSGYDCTTDIPNPNVNTVVTSADKKATITPSLDEGESFYDSLKFNDREPYLDLSQANAISLSDNWHIECYIDTVSDPGSGGVARDAIRCDAVAGELRGNFSDDSYDAPYNGSQKNVWIFIPESGGELKYYVTGVQTPKTYFVPVEKVGENFYFGTPGERNGK